MGKRGVRRKLRVKEPMEGLLGKVCQVARMSGRVGGASPLGPPTACPRGSALLPGLPAAERCCLLLPFSDGCMALRRLSFNLPVLRSEHNRTSFHNVTDHSL